jgi:hypothetical protein
MRFASGNALPGLGEKLSMTHLILGGAALELLAVNALF